MQHILKTLVVVMIAMILGCGGGSDDDAIVEAGLDTDRDGLADSIDPDDDNDGVMDHLDAFPFDPNETADVDGDGTGDNADTDDDNDGVADHLDAFPFDPVETADFDGDGMGDNADTDDDNDGIADTDDPRPYTKLKKATVMGSFFVNSPAPELAPMKVLFAIDCSQTMLVSDPSTPDALFGQRIEAVRRFIDRYNTTGHPNISFSIILWAGNVIDQTRNGNGDPGFTRSTAELNRVLDNVTLNIYTDYIGTMHAIRDVIHNDIDTTLLNATGEADVARTRYSVCFLSDGKSNTNAGDQPAEDIWDLIEALDTSTSARGAGEFNLHTFFLSALFRDASGDYLTDSGTVAARQHTENTLFGMAQRGNGGFLDIAAANAIDFINFSDLRLTVDYRLQSIIAYNLNVLPHGDDLQEDSDGDGLTDAEEVRPTGAAVYITNPTVADTDADGLSDYCELSISEPHYIQDPTVPDSGPCPSLPDGSYADSDGDGLNDCEEVAMATDPHMADTDRDALPDHVEHLYGTDPLLDNVLADMDLDGEIDWFEMRKHTNVRFNDPTLRLRHPYVYEIIDAGRDPVSLLRRYDFRVSNIGILDTGGSTAGGVTVLLPGENHIRLLMTQVPEGMPDVPPLLRAADVIFDYGAQNHDAMLLNSDFHFME